jgi:Polysaccharide pyruvyl transferase/2OG-Fe(II) oxygenase superfamily
MQTMDVQTLMQEVSEQIHLGLDSGQPRLEGSLRSASPWPDMDRLASVGRALRARKALIGQMPSAPPTLRGRMGALLVRMVRRSLVWFTGPLDDFHSEIVEGFDFQLAALKSLTSEGVQRRQLAEVSAELTRGLVAEMTARESAERALRVEIAERETLTLAVAENLHKRQGLEASYRRIETALYGMHSEIASQGMRISNLGKEAPATNPHAHGPSTERHWEIGICGTFDVSNYGDLLFPLIAESELRLRLGDVTLRRFSYNSKACPSWPYDVTSLTELPELIHRLDGLLIGGGLLVRFDKDVAPGYAPPTAQIHHPTGYWLSPALMALQHNVPLVWNAPGAGGNLVREWARPLVETAMALSSYVSVRDEQSREALAPLTYRPIAVVPDTAFGLDRLLNLQHSPSPEFTCLAEAYGLKPPYIVFQPNLGFEGLIRVIRDHPERFGKFQFLVLPISPEFGESSQGIEIDLPNVIRLNEWPNPLVIAELIGRAEAAIGHSFHFNISALIGGVPVFRRAGLSAGKFTALREFDTIFVLPRDGETDVEWFLARIGRKPPSASVLATVGPLNDHWDRIAGIFLARSAPTAPALNRLWQSLPGLLERGSSREATVLPGIVDGHREFATPPPKIINLKAVRNHRLEVVPYRWAVIDNLFDPDGARELADSYPCDHFKLVAGNDGEKAFEYEVRSLIGMGADTVAYPDDLSAAWRALAADLLSPDYRTAMSVLTGYDLSESPLEVNVFHYGPGCSLGAHKDLPDKIVTHVLYFNRTWNRSDGGCLCILGSKNLTDLVTEVLPVIGNSAVIVRSEESWHAVSRVVDGSVLSRRSVTVTFYRPGAISTMWPRGDNSPLHRYRTARLQ